MARPLLTIEGVPVEREEFPASPEELRLAVSRAFAEGSVMIPAGGETKLHLGNTAPRGAVALRTTRLRGIVEYEPDNMTVSVLAGTPLAEVQGVLEPRRQFIPLDPPRPDRATVGGLISCNSSGPLRFRYGTIRDILLGVKIVHADGTATKAGGKLVKNVTGYDMCKLYTGALGTLGILTEATFKLMPLPEEVATIVLGLPSMGEAMETVKELLRADLLPEALEAWNSDAFAHLGQGSSAAPWALMIRIGDVRPAVAWQEARALEIAAARSLPVLLRFGTGESEPFWARAAGAREPGGDGNDMLVKCSVLHRAVAETAEEMRRFAGELGGRIELFCHAGSAVLYGRCVWDGAESAPEAVRGALAGLRRFCAGCGGHMVAEKIGPEVKAGFDVWGYDAPALEVMRRIKREFDPRGLLNRGRFVGGI